MGATARAIGIICGVIAAAGSAVLIVMGHRPWYSWVTLVTGVGTVWTIWALGRAERAQPADAAPGE